MGGEEEFSVDERFQCFWRMLGRGCLRETGEEGACS